MLIDIDWDQVFQAKEFFLFFIFLVLLILFGLCAVIPASNVTCVLVVW